MATKGSDRRIYVQVAYEITQGNVGREFGNYDAVNDNWPKFVVSRDTVPLSRNGIRHVNIVNFLMAEDIEAL